MPMSYEKALERRLRDLRAGGISSPLMCTRLENAASISTPAFRTLHSQDVKTSSIRMADTIRLG
jgi:hypothetical protein